MTVEQDLRELEEQTLNSSVRTSPVLMGRLLADNFQEFGASGRVWGKAEILGTLGSEREIAEFEIDDLKVKLLENTHALVTYKLVVLRSGNSRSSLRSSVWELSEQGWQMIFHQGTHIL